MTDAGDIPGEREPRGGEVITLPPGARDLDTKLVAALERVGQALRMQQWDLAKEHGLNPAQVQVLCRLSVDRSPRRRVSVLADELGVSRPTMSDTVAALRRKGLVERAPVPRGGAYTLTLTGRGRAVAAQAAGWGDQVQAQIAAMARDDKEQMLGLLLELIAKLHQQGIITVARTCLSCRFLKRDTHGSGHHHCALLDAPLTSGDLRVDCPEHQAA